MSLTPNLIRRLSAVVAACLMASLLALGSGAAQAAEVGKLLITPSSGNQSTAMTVNTLVPCPEGSATLRIDLVGAGIAENNGVMTSNTEISQVAANPNGGYTIPVGELFSAVFQNNSLKDPTGTYTLSVLCFDSSGFVGQGEINGKVEFTPTAGDYNATWVQLPNGESTTTTLAATPADPVTQGTPSTLTATVVPSAAAGAVQFKSGSTNLGSPVAVAGGTAQYVGALPAGTNSLTANFIPSDSNTYTPSTSNAVSYVVAGAASITGTPRVGAKITCAIAAGGTITYAWTKGGAVIAGVTTKDVMVPASWLGGSVACKATVTKDATTVTQTGAAKTIGLGAAPVATVRPKLTGTPKVGRKLTCSKGTWSPTPDSYKYKWFRGTKVIKGATKATYRLVAADRAKKVACQVTVKKAGYADGKARSAAKRIS